MRRLISLTVLVLLMACPLFAQVPNMRSTVDQVFAAAKWDLGTKPENGCFTEEVAFRLHKLDPDWGHLRKFRETWWNGHAADAVLHKTGYALDIISHSDDPSEAKPGWAVEKKDGKPFARYTDAEKYFMVPTAGCLPTEPGPVDPPPPPPPPPPVDNEVKALLVEMRAALAAQTVDIQDLKRLSAELTAAVLKLNETAEKFANQKLPCFTAKSKVLGNIVLCPQE